MTEVGVAISERDRVVIARLEGEIDFSNIGEVGDDLRSAVSNEAVGLVIDLSAVRYVDSAGIRMLFDLARRGEATRQGFGLVLGEDSPLRTLVRVTKLDDVVLLCLSVDACVEELIQGSADRI